MDTKTFIDIVNNNITQHYAIHPGFVDVVFATFRAEEKEDVISVSGAWINFKSHTPLGYDDINIKKSDIANWTLQARYPGK